MPSISSGTMLVSMCTGPRCTATRVPPVTRAEATWARRASTKDSQMPAKNEATTIQKMKVGRPPSVRMAWRQTGTAWAGFAGGDPGAVDPASAASAGADPGAPVREPRRHRHRHRCWHCHWRPRVRRPAGDHGTLHRCRPPVARGAAVPRRGGPSRGRGGRAALRRAALEAGMEAVPQAPVAGAQGAPAPAPQLLGPPVAVEGTEARAVPPGASAGAHGNGLTACSPGPPGAVPAAARGGRAIRRSAGHTHARRGPVTPSPAWRPCGHHCPFPLAAPGIAAGAAGSGGAP